MGPERKIQVKVIEYAKKEYGALCKKLESGKFASTGWPDYLIVGRSHRHTPVVIFMEFKAPGKKLTELQYHFMVEIESRGFHYYTVFTVEGGKKVLDKEFGG